MFDDYDAVFFTPQRGNSDVVKEFCTPQLSCFVTIQPILPWPTRLGLMDLHEIRFFALKKQC
ncbi:MAG: hypothetical protein KZQ62_16855 [Candidatus Thiodiazotropha sp. (ex Lucinoma aequizonata)]|nr:hypothetical protein [Candidatus Thiodiazotropha sp. (ex Lucinoma aequizonata)]MCU7900560.1 hypothetical protein [Candidatus Thiodiazotropha sp. (ex Lucinoma aequizonata)]